MARRGALTLLAVAAAVLACFAGGVGAQGLGADGASCPPSLFNFFPQGAENVPQGWTKRNQTLAGNTCDGHLLPIAFSGAPKPLLHFEPTHELLTRGAVVPVSMVFAPPAAAAAATAAPAADAAKAPAAEQQPQQPTKPAATTAEKAPAAAAASQAAAVPAPAPAAAKQGAKATAVPAYEQQPPAAAAAAAAAATKPGAEPAAAKAQEAPAAAAAPAPAELAAPAVAEDGSGLKFTPELEAAIALAHQTVTAPLPTHTDAAEDGASGGSTSGSSSAAATATPSDSSSSSGGGGADGITQLSGKADLQALLARLSAVATASSASSARRRSGSDRAALRRLLAEQQQQQQQAAAAAAGGLAAELLATAGVPALGTPEAAVLGVAAAPHAGDAAVASDASRSRLAARPAPQAGDWVVTEPAAYTFSVAVNGKPWFASPRVFNASTAAAGAWPTIDFNGDDMERRADLFDAAVFRDGINRFAVTVTALAGTGRASNGSDARAVPAQDVSFASPEVYFYLFFDGSGSSADSRPYADISFKTCSQDLSIQFRDARPAPVLIDGFALTETPVPDRTTAFFLPVFYVYGSYVKGLDGTTDQWTDNTEGNAKSFGAYVTRLPGSPSTFTFSAPELNALKEGWYEFSVEGSVWSPLPQLANLLSVAGLDRYGNSDVMYRQVWPGGLIGDSMSLFNSTKGSGWVLPAFNRERVGLQKFPTTLDFFEGPSAPLTLGEKAVFSWAFSGLEGKTRCVVQGGGLETVIERCYSPLTHTVRSTLNQTLVLSYTDVCGATHNASMNFGTSFGWELGAAPPSATDGAGGAGGLGGLPVAGAAGGGGGAMKPVGHATMMAARNGAGGRAAGGSAAFAAAAAALCLLALLVL